MPQLTDDEVLQSIITAVHEVALKKVDADSPLLGGDGLDSMGVVNLLVLLQERFPIELLLSEVTPESFGSARRLVGVIQGKLRDRR